MNENMPQNKVLAGLPITGAAGFVCWLCRTAFDFEVPADQALYAVGVIVFCAQYFIRNREQQKQ